jgi:hypothetical protein
LFGILCLHSRFWVPACAGTTDVFDKTTVIPAKAGIQNSRGKRRRLYHLDYQRPITRRTLQQPRQKLLSVVRDFVFALAILDPSLRWDDGGLDNYHRHPSAGWDPDFIGRTSVPEPRQKLLSVVRDFVFALAILGSRLRGNDGCF